ncbi:MAG: CAP domain-containing protein [Verrucomicrobiota bacterium]|nr:CAP domain-containing protein [Verrucomicrobiota bacterium]
MKPNKFNIFITVLGIFLGLNPFNLVMAQEPSNTITPVEIVKVINEIRSEHKIPALHLDATLSTYSSDWALTIAKKGKLVHRFSSNLKEIISRENYNGLCENIAFHSVQGSSAQKIVTSWMNSPSHRTNLLRENNNRCGIGIAIQGSRIYVVFNGADSGLYGK